MIELGTKKVDNMEEAWVTAVCAAADTKTGNMDLKTTMEMVRSDVTFKQKRSRL